MNSFTLSSFIAQFHSTSQTIAENFNEVNLSIKSDAYKELIQADFASQLLFVNDRDNLTLSFIINEGESIDFYSGNDPSDFIKDVQSRMDIIDDEDVEIEINVRITKNNSHGVSSIYTYNSFIEFISGLTAQALISEFNQHLKLFDYIIFEFQEAEAITTTNSIWFVNKGFVGVPEVTDRDKFVNKAKTACHSNFMTRYMSIPTDFAVITSECVKLNDILNKLTIISSIIFLYDITLLNGNLLEYKLNGYKSISETIDTTSISTDTDQTYYKIYQWAYNEGNFNDKIGLVRNIISLHLDKKDRSRLNGEPFLSIQSSYKVYEKQNIKQYIEIRNKISDQLLNFHDRANKIIETFASGFQKSALALITFYTSAIILKILNKDKLIEVFTIDASILSSAFIICSLVYFFVLKWEVKAQKIRFNRNYNDIKERYSDLLDEQDITRILNNDKEFGRDISFIDSKSKAYTLMWVSFLIILFVTTWTLYLIYNPILLHNIYDWFRNSFSC